MANKYNSPRYKIAAIVFALSLLASLTLGIYGPMMLGMHAKPQWMFLAQLALGLISIATVPMAWRWLYLRDAA